MSGLPTLAVVGHVEWVEFAHVDRLPGRGEVAHAESELCEPAGGGAVAAVQLARLGEGCELHTALGADELGERSRERLAALGLSLRAQTLELPTRRALTLLDAGGERTIITLGARLEPRGAAMEDLGPREGVYFTAGDRAALERARRAARVLTLTPRSARAAAGADVECEALIYSSRDQLEVSLAKELEPSARLVLRTAGADGGEWAAADGSHGTWGPAPVPGEPRDSYGCGDSFAAGVTFALACDARAQEAASLGARCAAMCLTGRGPYERQLTRADL